MGSAARFHANITTDLLLWILVSRTMSFKCVTQNGWLVIHKNGNGNWQMCKYH